MNHHPNVPGKGTSAQNEASKSKIIDRMVSGMSEAKNDVAELDHLLSFGGGAHGSSLFVATDQPLGSQKAHTTKNINGLPSMNQTLFKRVQSTQALGFADEMEEHVANIRTSSIGEHGEGSIERRNSTEYAGPTRSLGVEQASAIGTWKDHAVSHVQATPDAK
jgi:hypothetical protein